MSIIGTRVVRTEDPAFLTSRCTGRHRAVKSSDVLAAEVPLLAALARTVGDQQVRHRGTIGGSLAHADPAADLPAAVLALGGDVVPRSARGRRRVPSTAFATGVFSTVKRADELVVEIRVPRTGGAGWACEKFTRRAADWATDPAADLAATKEYRRHLARLLTARALTAAAARGR